MRAARRFLLKRSVCEGYGWYGEVVTCFTPIPKQECRYSLDSKHCALTETKISGTEKIEKILSFNALTVALVVASRKGIIQTNFENASTHTRMIVLPALLPGNFLTKSTNSLCIGLWATSDDNSTNLVF
jgi:hypothetical protein